MRWQRQVPIVLLLAIVFAGGYLLAQFTQGEVGASQSDQVNHNTTTNLEVPYNPNSISTIVKEHGDAVVRISTTFTREASNPFSNDPFFNQLFGDNNPFQLEEKGNGLGTGLIISKDGYILTNNHVIENADVIEVTINGYEEPLKAKLIGCDQELDLAVLKVSTKKDLPFLTLGDSNQTQVGEWVIAIGNPYGLDHTVTVGVISAKERPLTIDGHTLKGVLQTDASINPGNSGGPLLNMHGEVIGINTAINASAQGIGFAIPSSQVKEVLNDLIEKGKVVRPWLGVNIQSINADLQEYFKLDSTDGAIIAGVATGSPAEKAGLQRGDVILELNNEKVKSADQFVDMVKELKVGDKAILLITRNGQSQYVTVKIGEKTDPVN
ncbi:S1C family serine protease [Rubeoparvulum massiliense]|uniref:S1C family serine protease n=1 Tax=Rubeoparvulum massiliense TaxID=1631346 RepID=UPI00065E3D3E|nr:trypsin-like peptidase domain-containing protein [Rubeoparvulum massiliense]